MEPLPGHRELTSMIPMLAEKLELAADKVSVSPLKGGNNRVYRLSVNDQAYIVKQYFSGRRNRLETEYGFIEFAWKNGIRQIPAPVFSMARHQFACYRYIPGQKLSPEGITGDHISQVLRFVKQLNLIENRQSAAALSLPNASEACFTVNAHMTAVGNRIARLAGILPKDGVDEAARQFVGTRLKPAWERISSGILEREFPDETLPRSGQILSPSDFGFHNAIRKNDGKLIFIDFEYAGWDDPVKLVCDFFCHVAVPVPMRYLDVFSKGIGRMVPVGPDFEERITAFMPLYRLKWCCIMMNDFLASDEKRKKFAAFHADRRAIQLEKAEQYADNYLQEQEKR